MGTGILNAYKSFCSHGNSIDQPNIYVDAHAYSLLVILLIK